MITLFVGLLALTGLAIVGLFWRIPRFATVLLIAYLAFLSWIFWFEPRSLSITHQTIAVEGLDAPVKIVAIGDPQPTAHHWPASRLRAAFATAQAQEPDIVLWLGDYVYESRFFGMVGLREEVFVEPAEIVAAMAELNPKGVVPSLVDAGRVVVGSLKIAAMPAAPVPVAQIVGAAMAAPQSVIGVLNLKVTANE